MVVVIAPIAGSLRRVWMCSTVRLAGSVTWRLPRRCRRPRHDAPARPARPSSRPGWRCGGVCRSLCGGSSGPSAKHPTRTRCGRFGEAAGRLRLPPPLSPRRARDARSALSRHRPAGVVRAGVPSRSVRPARAHSAPLSAQRPRVPRLKAPAVTGWPFLSGRLGLRTQMGNRARPDGPLAGGDAAHDRTVATSCFAVTAPTRAGGSGPVSVVAARAWAPVVGEQHRWGRHTRRQGPRFRQRRRISSGHVARALGATSAGRAATRALGLHGAS